METTRTTIADPTQYAMDISVTMDNGSIQVGGGSVVMQGRTESLSAETIPVAIRTSPTVVLCYLVRERASDALVLFLDEHVQDGLDQPYIFERDGEYDLLAYLFMVTVPAGTNDLRTLAYDRWRIVAGG